MDWIQFLGFILTIGGLFVWNRTESNADRRELKSSIDALKISTDQQISAIHSEIKDFHGKLLVLEDRYLRLREKE